MRKLLFGLFGFVALGFGALSVQPAEAQPYYPGYYGPSYRPVVQYRTRPAYRPVVEYRRVVRPSYRPYRPAPVYRPVRTVQRCWVETRRTWNGYRWLRRPIEVCRTVPRPYARY
jgi:hypothetical protein